MYTPDCYNKQHRPNLASMDETRGETGVTYHELLSHPSLLFGDPERIAILKETAIQREWERRKHQRIDNLTPNYKHQTIDK